MPRPGRSDKVRRREHREVVIRGAGVFVRARLLSTPTADRIWSTLPIYAKADIWNSSVRLGTQADAEREPAARRSVAPGEIAFWSERRCIVIAFGALPARGEIRLPAPSNVWATALDDLSVLARVRSGDGIAVLVAES